MPRTSALQNVIFDPESGKRVAIIRNGELFRDDQEGARIAIFVGAYLYDLKGNWLGHFDASARALPIGLRELLDDRSTGKVAASTAPGLLPSLDEEGRPVELAKKSRLGA
jgi:hypothetical protein